MIYQHTDTSQAVGYRLKAAQHGLRTAMDAELRELGLTTPQYAVLTFLEQSPGLSGAQLARRAFVTPQTMQRILANLQAAGLVERDPHPEVGRVIEARLSGRGRALLQEGYGRAEAIEARMLADLTPDEQRQLAELLERCTRALRSTRQRPRIHRPTRD